MAQPSLKPPSTLQPRPKAFATFSSTSIAAKSTTSTPQFSTPISQSRQPSPVRLAPSADVSDKATASLIRKVLCPHSHAGEKKPVDELLPPLTSSNEVDLQLYAIIAIIVKDLVQSWYGKITPDQAFVEEVVQIVAHCTRALESRLRTVDLEALVLDEIPQVIEKHIQIYRLTHQSPRTQPLSIDPRTVYHDLCPHPALSPVPLLEDHTIDEQRRNESDYRQLLVQGALAVLLPTEDLENACLRTLVADVIAEVILGNAIGGKVCEGWFIWAAVKKSIDVVKDKVHPRTTGEAVTNDTRGRLEKYGLLTAREEKQEAERPKHTRRSAISSILWHTLQLLYLMTISIRFVVVGLFAASSQPLRSSTIPRATTSLDASPIEKRPLPTRQKPPPLLRFRVFSLLSTLLDLPIRSPWLSGSLALLQHHLVEGILPVAATDGFVDQYIHHVLKTYLQPEQLLPSALRLLRQTLFQNSSVPISASPPPPAAQIFEIKRDCAESILSLLPHRLQRQWFATTTATATAVNIEDPQHEMMGDDEAFAEQSALGDIERELDIWSDAYLNKHVAYSVLELVLVRVLPELADESVSSLVRGRLGDNDTEGGTKSY